MTNPDTASPGRGDSPATTISELTVEADHEARRPAGPHARGAIRQIHGGGAHGRSDRGEAR